jgi:hypothetical protein
MREEIDRVRAWARARTRAASSAEPEPIPTERLAHGGAPLTPGESAR